MLRPSMGQLNMNEWLKSNAWSLIIAGITLISTFSLYGYRIDDLDKQINEQKAAIAVLNTQQNAVNVQLAQIATDINYIKSSLDRVLGR